MDHVCDVTDQPKQASKLVTDVGCASRGRGNVCRRTLGPSLSASTCAVVVAPDILCVPRGLFSCTISGVCTATRKKT